MLKKLTYPILVYFLSIFITTNSLNIDDFGAKSNDPSYETSINNGLALTNCILAANSSTDRTILIPKGKNYTLLPSGIVQNLINITIQIDGVLTAFNGDHKLWPNDTTGHTIAVISLTKTVGLVIKGEGLIEGNGYSWWLSVFINGHDNRPNLIDVITCKDTLVEGITLQNAPEYNHNFLDALNLTMQNLKILTNVTDRQKSFPIFPLNTDGIDIRGKDIIIRNLTVENYDDAVAVKPSHLNQNVYSNCTENILIENCYVKFGVGMSIGSVPPNPQFACVRNVTVRNIVFDTPFKAIYIKPNPGNNGQGLISDITYENIEIHEPLWWAIYIGTQQQQQPHGGADTGCSFLYPLPGTKCPTNPLVTVRNINLINVNIYGGLLSPGVLICNQSNPCENLVFNRVNVYNNTFWPVKDGYLCENFSGIAIESNLVPSCLKKLD